MFEFSGVMWGAQLVESFLYAGRAIVGLELSLIALTSGLCVITKCSEGVSKCKQWIKSGKTTNGRYIKQYDGVGAYCM